MLAYKDFFFFGGGGGVLKNFIFFWQIYNQKLVNRDLKLF